jgi:hypothetical protein
MVLLGLSETKVLYNYISFCLGSSLPMITTQKVGYHRIFVVTCIYSLGANRPSLEGADNMLMLRPAHDPMFSSLSYDDKSYIVYGN